MQGLVPLLMFCAVCFFGTPLHADAAALLPGDVNVDSTVDVADAVLLSRFCAEDDTVALTARGLANADVNRDRNITNDDVVLVLRVIARVIPAEDLLPPENTAGTTTTAATTTTTVTTTTTTVTTTVTTTTVVTTTVTAVTASTSADGSALPLNAPLSVLTGQRELTEQLTAAYDIGSIVFSVFAQDPKKTTIAVSLNDTIVGYYLFCKQYSIPAAYSVTEYTDTLENIGVYAVLILKDGVDIRYPHLNDQSDLSVHSKLNFYAVNGVRAINSLYALRWENQVAAAALSHSQEMADKDYFDHASYDGTRFS